MYVKTTCGDAPIHYKVLSLIFLCEKEKNKKKKKKKP